MALTEDQIRNRVAQARALKAIHIADVLTRAGADVASARNLSAEGRRLAEQEAQVRPASEDTWAVVFSVLERREESSREDAEEHERRLLGTNR